MSKIATAATGAARATANPRAHDAAGGPARKPGPLTALVLQGGGALGAYQAGAYEVLSVHYEEPDLVAGISIGAINAALIAGNPPQQRVQRLREFWERVTIEGPTGDASPMLAPMREWLDQLTALWGASVGVPGFFTPRWMSLGTSPGAQASFYDTAPLAATLRELVDFDRINDGPMHLSVGAVDIQSGNFSYFDNRNQRIGPEHILASGALPPGFPPVEVDGHWYWDGGLVSNTPLSEVVGHLDARAREQGGAAATIFQIDLFNALGKVPGNLSEAAVREKEIRYSSRTRAVTNHLRERIAMRERIRALIDMIPQAQRKDPRVVAALGDCVAADATLVHVIRRAAISDSHAEDYEFSRLSMRDHWRAGARDMTGSLKLLASCEERPTHALRIIDWTAPGDRKVIDE